MEPDGYGGGLEAGINKPANEENQHYLRDNGGAPDDWRGRHEESIPEPVKRRDIYQCGKEDEDKQ